jgi:hypothetical protein
MGKKPRKVEGLYMDYVDFMYELGSAAGGNKVFPSVRNLKENRTCWPTCGIVEVEVRLVRIVKKPRI